MKILPNTVLFLTLILGVNYEANRLTFGSIAQAADCVANNNLSSSAQEYIGRCRKGSINSEFPGEMYRETLGIIKDGKTANHKKAWKLLNDNRFAK